VPAEEVDECGRILWIDQPAQLRVCEHPLELLEQDAGDDELEPAGAPLGKQFRRRTAAR